MAVARVVTFDGVTSERLEAMQGEMEGGQPPEGLDATEFLVLHDPEAERSMVILFFADDDAYRRGNEILDAMPAGDTPGSRTSVARYDVAMRMTN
jgi:hypothetical protein